MITERVEALRKAQVAGYLELICQTLELSDTQYQLAKSRYEAVGAWLAEGDGSLFQGALIYPQGSAALGTTVKPLGRAEFDVDLVLFLPSASIGWQPSVVKSSTGARLRANGLYAPILQEKMRCWRLNYAGAFHLDITPSIINPGCGQGGELVPDKQLREWKATNPRGYRAAFARRATLQPRGRITESAVFKGQQRDVQPYPAQLRVKGLLCRCVQIEKRHRDVYFEHHDPALAPISVIVTTLTAQSYEYCVTTYEYETELDLLRDVARHMPEFIYRVNVAGRVQWSIPNETTEGENFAEKWNREPALVDAFDRWHRRLVTDLDALTSVEGVDRLTESLGASFGRELVAKAMRADTDRVSTARANQQLWVAPGSGLTLLNGTGTRVPPNTNFGAA